MGHSQSEEFKREAVCIALRSGLPRKWNKSKPYWIPFGVADDSVQALAFT